MNWFNSGIILVRLAQRNRKETIVKDENRKSCNFDFTKSIRYETIGDTWVDDLAFGKFWTTDHEGFYE